MSTTATMMTYFLYGLSFAALGFTALLQLRRGGDFPLRKQLPWLAAFGIAAGLSGWTDMFLVTADSSQMSAILDLLRIVLQPITGLLLLRFGWGVLAGISPLPAWTIFIPGVLIVPIAYVITYAASTFVTPSPIEIPIDIWSRYLMYLPGSILAGIGFLRQWHEQKRLGYGDVSGLMLGAGVAFLFEALVVGLVVPAAPYGPASYYNYDRTLFDAFRGESSQTGGPYGLIPWLDYQSVLQATGLPIEFWRMLSALAVTFFVARGLDVFEAVQKRQMLSLQQERDSAQNEAYQAQITARHTAENWTEALVTINRRIVAMEDVDEILLYIVENARSLLRADFAGLALCREDHSALDLRCFSTDACTQLVTDPQPVTNPTILELVQDSSTCRSLRSEGASPLEGAAFFVSQPARALGAVCISLDGVSIGALWVARGEEHPFVETDLIWLECLADQIEIAIKHGLMTSQLQSLSIAEERGRIAREMHDGLAQVLGYLNLEVQTLEALLAQGKLDPMRRELDQMHTAVQNANADVRESILSLRTTLSNKEGLIASIADYLDEFGLQAGVNTHFLNELQGESNLASVAEVQLVCIMQEALTNVRKHARATNVWVKLSRETSPGGDTVVLLVSDDGIGFEAKQSKLSFGLQTMRERALGVNGELEVHSTPGKGTTVLCRMPMLRVEPMETPTGAGQARPAVSVSAASEGTRSVERA